MNKSRPIHHHFRLALFWAVLGGLGSLAIFPYSLVLNPAIAAMPNLSLIAVSFALQTGILLIPLSWIGLRLGRSMGLQTPIARALVYQQPLPKISRSALKATLTIGIVSGILLIGLIAVFQPWMPPMNTLMPRNIDLWKRGLAAFYGGITEELMLRLFGMTLIAWLLWKGFDRRSEKPSHWIFWSAIGGAAILFGVGHLPTAVGLWGLTPIVLVRTLLLNGLPALGFGFLYWRWGLEYAMLAHFCADIVLHVLGGG